jgi:hypothetical protein
VAVIANDALGNYAIQTSILTMIRRELSPSHILAVSGTRVAEFLDASTLADSYWLLHGSKPEEGLNALLHQGTYDLVLNLESTTMSKVATSILGRSGYVCGPCLNADCRGDYAFPDDDRGDLWRDKSWISDDLPIRFPFLKTGFIAEIFARLCFLSGPVAPYDLPCQTPPIPVPEVLLSCSASLTSKAWSRNGWLCLVSHLQAKGLSIGMLGASRKVQSNLYSGIDLEDDLVHAGVLDLRGALTLPQVVGAIASARLVVTLDNGILHLAAATETPTVGLFRHGIHRLWAPPAPNIVVLEPGEGNDVHQIPLEAVTAHLEF